MTNKKKKIMIAEDDKFLANAYRVKLEKEGFEVNIVGHGKELLEKLEDFDPDLVLMDLVMPIMDGFEALKKMKEDKKTEKVPVLVASNLGQQADLDKSMELGAVDYIIKSNVSMKDVVEKIKELAK